MLCFYPEPDYDPYPESDPEFDPEPNADEDFDLDLDSNPGSVDSPNLYEGLRLRLLPDSGWSIAALSEDGVGGNPANFRGVSWDLIKRSESSLTFAPLRPSNFHLPLCS